MDPTFVAKVSLCRMTTPSIAQLDAPLAALCEAQFALIGYRKPAGYFHACLDQQVAGTLVCFVAYIPGPDVSPGDGIPARDAARYVGHTKLVWQPDYPPFRRHAIPEIQDLNVLPAFRQQGIGTALIRRCEALASTRSRTIGIGVGLHPGYNAAQRLYSRLGYLIDGHGVHYHNAPVEEGQSYPFDDDLVLYFTKSLADSPAAAGAQPL
jgi:GNAT superfamily N-acetyltransferase